MSLIWAIQLADTAKKQLTKLAKKNPQQAQRILNYLKELQSLENPRDRGKGLVGELSGMWRYRVGDYRIICHIDNGKLLITALELGHRREIYH
ncbi:type II toxin-antitoxin system RelE/ParE family toxin [Muribacter muris]|uniref:Type II toxin-antitoxin system RelE/ParE family toxin n=1 Tax=Muribacter muris TaxID=67855 RepID=A0A4Y9JV74_9PAST|nr:type II toxin-antitoxin system RelE/ParE family toxin [Muribacter muris]MBF0785799.1 type II toxin-antitoxin system RelE/ParE family toxin [Muribacter muris]MBF0828229.1 type II toxin-antitoxin system RelE/ParE family toxin [Muribacter muris]TFV08620.1 type II toxin-antitoxin system RelE/ParE family toxin [Muribacter muris]